MKRLIIISNRLPIKVVEQENKFEYTRSAGGLATGLDSLDVTLERHWIGWPGMYPNNAVKKSSIEQGLLEQSIHPVFLTPDQIQNFYEGYCNSTIWPLFHYFYVYTDYDKRYWDSYKEVNQLFFEAVLKIVQPNDLIWIHDYQLMLLPGLIKVRFPTCRIGFFLHIPFPSYELFRVLPERAEILHGLLGADLIGFHTFDYMRHFISSVYRILGLECDFNEVIFNNRVVRIDSFPMGINYDQYNSISSDIDGQKYIKEFRDQFKNKKIILSVDRLDYSKGILHRLKAFDSFLETYPVYKKNVVLVLIVVPSRDGVEKYQDLKIKIDEFVGYLNGKYNDIDWSPVQYLYRSFDLHQLAALYYVSDIALVTPLRDGMNLIAKEFIATKNETPGALILSEMAGAYIELPEAIHVNPNNVVEIRDAIFYALNIPETEQKLKTEKMRAVIKRQSVSKWANDFIQELESIGDLQQEIRNKYVSDIHIDNIITKYKHSDKRLFLLDYDGTLVGFSNDPAKAAPDEKLRELINQMISVKQNKIVIISGRSRQSLEEWFPQNDLILVAEHGTFFRENYKWIRKINIDDSWKEEISELMQKVTDKTPGSLIEVKESAIVWHYRKTDLWLADLRIRQLIESLIYPSSRLNLQIMRGNKILEVKVPDADKGSAVKDFLNRNAWDFILAAGDDTTDEDMFRMLPEEAITIKIGSISKNAKYNLYTHIEFLGLLRSLME